MTREAIFTHGPSFFTAEDGTVMFAYRVDASNQIGPRKATDADMARYQEALAVFNSDQLVPPMPEPEKRKPGRPKKAA
jgi:hypothetical protein